MSEEMTAPETVAEPAVEPVETVAPVAEATAEAPAEEEPQQPKPDRVAKRFSELTHQRDAERARAEREAEEKEYWRQQALARQAEPEPTQEEYAENPYSPDAIQAAVQRALATERQKAAQFEAQNAQATKAKTLQAKLYESGLEGAVLIASGADIAFTDAMIDALAVSEQPAQVAHHLGSNPGEAARIASLPPQLQGYELAKLESRLASQPKTTAAPPPPSTVGTRGNPVTGLRDDMSPEDWQRAFNASIRLR